MSKPGAVSAGWCYVETMFTGLVNRTGKLRGRRRSGPGFRLAIQADLAQLELGESVAVDGACLTVNEASATGFEADVSLETAERTTLGRIPVGSPVNLERALRPTDRLGGHLVTGHVDAVALVEQVTVVGDSWRIKLGLPRALTPFVAEKGSVALDGVSLTVNAVSDLGFEVMLVPHTREATSLREVRPGRQLNLEVDLLARYVVRYLTAVHGRDAHQADSAGSASGLASEQSLLDALKLARIL
jgi:riboflavin synthase